MLSFMIRHFLTTPVYCYDTHGYLINWLQVFDSGNLETSTLYSVSKENVYNNSLSLLFQKKPAWKDFRILKWGYSNETNRNGCIRGCFCVLGISVWDNWIRIKVQLHRDKMLQQGDSQSKQWFVSFIIVFILLYIAHCQILNCITQSINMAFFILFFKDPFYIITVVCPNIIFILYFYAYNLISFSQKKTFYTLT